MSKLKIGYTNFIDNINSYSFSTGNEETGYEIANAADNTLYNHWKVGAGAVNARVLITLDQSRSVDYFAMYKNNIGELPNGGEVHLMYAASGSEQLETPDGLGLETPGAVAIESAASYGGYLIAATLTYTNGDTVPKMKVFTAVSSQNWAIQFDTDKYSVTVADLRFGSALTTEYGVYINFNPVGLAREVNYTDNRSISGLLVGRSIRRIGMKAILNLEFMTDTWLRSDWLPFVQHIERYPFYLMWSTDWDTEIAFANNDGPIDKPVHTHAGRSAVNVAVSGYIA